MEHYYFLLLVYWFLAIAAKEFTMIEQLLLDSMWATAIASIVTTGILIGVVTLLEKVIK